MARRRRNGGMSNEPDSRPGGPQAPEADEFTSLREEILAELDTTQESARLPPANKRLGPGALLAMSLAFQAAGCGVMVGLEFRYPGASIFAVGALCAGLALLRSGAMIVYQRGWERAAGIPLLLLSLALFFEGMMFTLSAFFEGFIRGRQVRRRGRIVLAPVHAGGAWAEMPSAAEVAAPDLARIAAQWRENGRNEHASVAAFARLTLDLMALGAPPELIAAANRDALDEIQHAELCFSLARRLDGQTMGPGPFPEASAVAMLPRQRSRALAKLAVDSLIDGALLEGMSARVIAKLSRRCEDQDIRRMMRQIAADEWRHAGHGWDALEWCVAVGGMPVRAALEGALSKIPATIASRAPAAARAGEWERFGIPGAELEAAEYARTLAEVRRRLEALLAGADGGAVVETLRRAA
jgi:hypothetical protein